MSIELIPDYKAVEIPKEEEKKKEVIKSKVVKADMTNIKTVRAFDVGIEMRDADIVFYAKGIQNNEIGFEVRIAKREMKKMFEQMYIDS